MSAPDAEGRYGLVMPFVVCASNGGPYDDDSFVAGVRMEAISRVLASGVAEHSSYEFPGLVPQLDLVAMSHGYAMTVEPHSDQRAYVRFAPVKDA